ncbi:histidine kinase [Paenibacillus sp. KQZ6P-2]|uniref:histidine kinase n=1 Tax=Paenibacillus mangrovi TaxID=2931978 RepID=A0A9X1WRW0_9BACL|nr:histidine kinase [Paenibacillus mangrovi]MCJ8012478.1 histidine kinase [Paenibacillus mangrovi]
MTYKQIKWMILFIPTLTVGIWEYVRHQFLLPYISMDMGNFLTPLIVYIVSVTLLNKLFVMLEKNQQELAKERSAKAALEAREQLAKELHDGIAQSLFLLSVKVDRLEWSEDKESQLQEIYNIRKKVHEVNRYVRQAISNLKEDVADVERANVSESLDVTLEKMTKEVHVDIGVNWEISDKNFTPKEKVELLACIREAVLNIEKHAEASKGWIQGAGDEKNWKVLIKDNGKGFDADPFQLRNHYGLVILKERAAEMNWDFQLSREDHHTIVQLSKEGDHRAENPGFSC